MVCEESTFHIFNHLFGEGKGFRYVCLLDSCGFGTNKRNVMEDHWSICHPNPACTPVIGLRGCDDRTDILAADFHVFRKKAFSGCDILDKLAPGAEMEPKKIILQNSGEPCSKLVQCRKCDRNVDSTNVCGVRSHVWDHLVQAGLGYPYSCRKCSFACSNSEVFLSHIKAVHQSDSASDFLKRTDKLRTYFKKVSVKFFPNLDTRLTGELDSAPASLEERGLDCASAIQVTLPSPAESPQVDTPQMDDTVPPAAKKPKLEPTAVLTEELSDSAKDIGGNVMVNGSVDGLVKVESNVDAEEDSQITSVFDQGNRYSDDWNVSEDIQFRHQNIPLYKRILLFPGKAVTPSMLMGAKEDSPVVKTNVKTTLAAMRQLDKNYGQEAFVGVFRGPDILGNRQAAFFKADPHRVDAKFLNVLGIYWKEYAERYDSKKIPESAVCGFEYYKNLMRKIPSSDAMYPVGVVGKNEV